MRSCVGMQYQHENFRRNYGDSHFQQPPHHSQGQGNGPQLSQTHHGRHNPMKHYEQYRPHEPPQYTQYQHSPYVPNAHQTQIQRQHPHATPQQTTGNWTSTASDGGYFPEELHTTEQQSRIGLQTFVQQRDEWHSQQLRQSYANEQQSHPLRSPNQRSPNQMQPPPVLPRPSEGLGLKLRQEQCPGPICITNVDDYGECLNSYANHVSRYLVSHTSHTNYIICESIFRTSSATHTCYRPTSCCSRRLCYRYQWHSG